MSQSNPATILQDIGTETAIFVGPAVLVASKSNPGEWHTVLNGLCSCVGFQHRGTCRHLAVALEAQERDRECATPIAEPCQCGVAPWTIRIRGEKYCGSCSPLPVHPRFAGLAL